MMDGKKDFVAGFLAGMIVFGALALLILLILWF